MSAPRLADSSPFLFRFPPEIITHILIFAAEGFSPVPLTHVNSFLRQIALRSSELWTRIHSRSTVRSEREYERISSYLERSANRCIDVSLFFGFHSMRTTGTEAEQEHIQRLFSMITPYLSRIERLVLAGGTHGIPVTIFTYPAPNLVHLSIDHFRYGGELPASFILSAPRLRTLRVRARGEKDTLHLLEIRAPLILLSLGALNADGNTRHRLSAMIRVVSAQASSLVTLYLSLPNASGAEVPNNCELIVLPNLKRLQLDEIHPRILGRITTPLLQDFSFSIAKTDSSPHWLTPDDLPILLHFFISHAKTLFAAAFILRAVWPVDGSGTATAKERLASIPRGVKFEHLRTLHLTLLSDQWRLIETIASDTLHTLSIWLESSGSISWATLGHFICRNSYSLTDISIFIPPSSHLGVFGEGVRHSIPVMILPVLKVLSVNGVAGDAFVSFIHSAPLLERASIHTQTPAEVFEMPAKRWLFPCLHTFQLIGQLTLLPSIGAPLLKRVVLGVEDSHHSELNDPLVLDFLSRHASTLTSISGSRGGLHTDPRPDFPNRIFSDNSLISDQRLSFPLLETVTIQLGDPLLSYFTTAPHLSHLSIWSSPTRSVPVQPEESPQSVEHPPFNPAVLGSIRTVELVNTPTKQKAKQLLWILSHATDVSRLIITTDWPFPHVPNKQRELTALSVAVFQVIISSTFLPHLTELDLPAPHEDLRADFYTGLKEIVTNRLNSQVKALRSITLRSLTTLDNDIRSWLKENVPETIFLRSSRFRAQEQFI